MKFSKFTFLDLTSISNASPAVLTYTAHELNVGDRIWLETTGTLPSPLAVDTNYWVINNKITANTFCISDIPDGTAVNTTSAGSGTHSFQKQNKANLTPRSENNK